MSKRNRERKEKQRSAFGPPRTPQQRGYTGGTMTQTQCACGQTFPHMAALNEHQRTSPLDVCAPPLTYNPGVAARRSGKSTQLYGWQKEILGHFVGVDLSYAEPKQRERREVPEIEVHRAEINALIRDVHRLKNEMSRVIDNGAALERDLKQAKEEIASLKATIGNPRAIAEIRGRVDWTQSVDEEENLTSTERIPKGRIVF